MRYRDIIEGLNDTSTDGTRAILEKDTGCGVSKRSVISSSRVEEAIHRLSDASDDENTPYINAWIAPGSTIANIEMLFVPKGMRKSGIGQATYEKWEATLPTHIQRVELDAVDYGDGAGDAKPFWDRMGFDFKYTGDNLTHEEHNRMWKGVNGHPTPPTIDVDDYED